jgi:hypothetical protein
VAPWADAIYQKRKLEFGKDSMETQCRSTTVAVVTLAGAALSFDYDARGGETLLPLSARRFSWSGSVVEFVDAGGRPEMVIHYAESDERGPRRK